MGITTSIIYAATRTLNTFKDIFSYVAAGARVFLTYLYTTVWIFRKVKEAFMCVFGTVWAIVTGALEVLRWMSPTLSRVCGGCAANVTNWWERIQIKLERMKLPYGAGLILTIIRLILVPVFELWYVIWASFYDLVLGAIMYLFWYFFSDPLLAMGANTVVAVGTVDVISDGLEGLFNFLAVVANILLLIANSIRPLYLVVMGSLSKSLAQTVSLFLINTDAFLGGDERILKTNTFLGEVDNSYQFIEHIVTLILLPICSVLDTVLVFTNLLYGLLQNVLLEFTILLAKWTTTFTPIQTPSSGRSLASATVNPILYIICSISSTPAFFCVVRSLFRDLFLFVTLSALDIGLCKPSDLPGDTLCKCSNVYGGPFNIQQSCPPPHYGCILKPKGIWEEVIITYATLSKETTVTTLASGPDHDKVCKAFIRQSAQKGRSLESCSDSYCWQEGDTEWLFEQCGQARLIGSDCRNQRKLEGELWRAHLKKYNKRHPENRVLPSPPIKPPVIEEAPERMRGEDFMAKLAEVEQLPLSSRVHLDCPTIWDPNLDFLHLMWRTGCLILKVIDNHAFPDLTAPLEGRKLFETPTSIHHFMDQLAHLNNNFSSNQLPTTHEADFQVRKRQLDEVREHITRNLQAPRRKLEDLQDLPGLYLCPGGEYVPRDQLSDCPMPTNWTSLTTVRYAFYTLSSLEVTVDIVFLLQSALSCFDSYSIDPDTDPTVVSNIALWATGSRPADSFVYCPPLYPPIPYIPPITWSFSEFVGTQLCAIPIGGESPCACQQYNAGVSPQAAFDFNQPWTPISKEYIRVRLYKAGIAFQYMFTRIIQFPDAYWQLIATNIPFTGNPSEGFVKAFNPTYALYGLTEEVNNKCLVKNVGFVIWFLIFPLWDMIVFFNRYERDVVEKDEEGDEIVRKEKIGYAIWLYKWIRKLLTYLIGRPLNLLWTHISLRNALSQIEDYRKEGRKMNKELITQLKHLHKWEEKHKKKIEKEVDQTVKDANNIKNLMFRKFAQPPV